MASVNPPDRFATTRWSVVAAAADRRGSPSSDDAVAALCRAYWGPVYGYVRRRGWSPEDAEDLTQEFLARVLVDGGRLAGVNAARGRFRAFLLTCLKHHLTNRQDERSAAKRGGGRRPLSLQARDAEEQLVHDPADRRPTPDRAFDRAWAVALLGRALAAVAAEQEARGRRAWFDQVKVYLAADRSAPPYAVVADRLGTTEAAVKVGVHRLRAAFRSHVERELAATLADGADPADEVDDLFRAFE